MINTFRSKDKDTFIVFGFLSLLTLPFLIISFDRFPDFISKLGFICFICFWNMAFSGGIVSFLYINYVVSLDNGVKIIQNKTVRNFRNIFCVLVYSLNVYIMIYDPAAMRFSMSTSIIPFLMMQNDIYCIYAVIGETYVTNSRHTIRLASIQAIDRSKDESFSGLSLRGNKWNKF